VYDFLLVINSKVTLALSHRLWDTTT